MKQIRDTYKKTGKLHHAYGLLGEREKVREDLFAFLEKDLKFPTIGNPDFWQGEFNVFKIADSRAVNNAHQNKPVKYNRKVFVIFTNFITKDAQNSLLKIFEEPSGETTFFIIFPETIDLLPTLESRMVIVKGENINQKSTLNKKRNDLAGAEEFLSAKVGKRLQMTSKIVKNIKDEIITKSEAITFIKNLERAIKASWKSKKSDQDRGENILAIEDLEKAISYAGDESPSIKVILDHLALVL